LDERDVLAGKVEWAKSFSRTFGPLLCEYVIGDWSLKLALSGS